MGDVTRCILRYKCPCCNTLVNARKAFQIAHDPDILAVHLKRFHPLTFAKDDRQVWAMVVYVVYVHWLGCVGYVGVWGCVWAK